MTRLATLVYDVTRNSDQEVPIQEFGVRVRVRVRVRGRVLPYQLVTDYSFGALGRRRR